MPKGWYLKQMSFCDSLRAAWRQIKDPVLAGRGNIAQKAFYRLLSGFVTRNKTMFRTTDLQSLALWLMYHPESGVLPWDGWKMSSPPRLSPDELPGLQARYAGDVARVAERLGLETVGLLPQKAASEGCPRVAVHVHVFYPELLSRILAGLDCVPWPFDLFVSVPEGVSVPPELADLPRCVVERCPNRGRDIAPLVCTFGRRLSGYDCIAHFHTKKSTHVTERRDWLGHVLSCLLGSPERVNGIFRMLANGYGMVAASDYLPVPEDPTGWMRNLPYAEELARRGGLEVDLRRDFTPIAFPQGSMFWARSCFLRRFLEMPLSFDDFPVEPVGVDGSPAHALERLLFLWGSGSGLKVAKLDLGA